MKPILYVEINGKFLTQQKVCEIEQFLRTFDYEFYVNTGQRNSDHDEFDISRIDTITSQPRVYDVLCICPGSRDEIDRLLSTRI